MKSSTQFREVFVFINNLFLDSVEIKIQTISGKYSLSISVCENIRKSIMLSVNKRLYHIHTPNCLIFHFIRMAVHIHPKRINLTANFFAIFLQSNLSVADMLYSGYLVIADIFSQNWPNHGQTVKEKSPYSAHFQLLQRTKFFWYGVKRFEPNLPF